MRPGGLKPASAGLHGHRVYGFGASRCSIGDKGIVHRDGAHVVRPNEQRVRRHVSTQVIVSRCFHDEFHVVLAGEDDRSNDVRRLLRPDCIGRRCCRPGAVPTGGLQRPGLLLIPKRILQKLEGLGCGIDPRELGSDQTPSNLLVEGAPFGLRRPRLARSHERFGGTGSRTGESGGGSEGGGSKDSASGDLSHFHRL